MGRVSKREVLTWIYTYFKDCGFPSDCPYDGTAIFNVLEAQIKEVSYSAKETSAIAGLRQEILDTIMELQAKDERSAVSAKQIWESSQVLQSERQVMGVTNLLKALVDDGKVIKIPRPNVKENVRYYIKKQ